MHTGSKHWRTGTDSNRHLRDRQSRALPIELPVPIFSFGGAKASRTLIACVQDRCSTRLSYGPKLVDADGIEPPSQWLPGYSRRGSPHCPTHPNYLAGRVGFEPTYNSLTGSPPACGAPAKIGSTETTRTFTSRASTGRSTCCSYRRNVFAHRELPGPGSPHRPPD